MRRPVLWIGLVGMAACGEGVPQSTAQSQSALSTAGVTNVVSRRGLAHSKIQTGNGLQYNGGPVMHGRVSAYYIWYGSWAGNTAHDILTDMISNFGGSPNYNIDTTYADAQGAIRNAIRFGGSAHDNYSRGAALGDNDIGLIAQAHAGVDLPYDTNGVYFVLTSADVTENTGFCTVYCAWHGWQTIPTTGDLKVAFVGNPDQCPYQCAWEWLLPTPNNNVGADGMVDSIAHEFEESTSDPEGQSWVNPDGTENADMCAYTYGTTFNLANGSFANMRLGGRPYLIQRNWVNRKGGYCSQSWDD